MARASRGRQVQGEYLSHLRRPLLCNPLDHEISVEVKIRQTEEFGERLDALEKVQHGNGFRGV